MFIYLLSLSSSRRSSERGERGARGNASFLCFVVCLWRDFSLGESVFSLKCASEEEAERDNDAFFFVFFSVHFGSEEDAERGAEKTERGRERFFFVGFDRE